MSLYINNKKVTREEALKALNDDEKIVTQVAFEIANDSKVSGPPTMEGFEISKDTILMYAHKMDSMNADILRVTLSNIGKLGGKTMEITLRNSPPTRTEIFLRRLFRRWLA